MRKLFSGLVLLNIGLIAGLFVRDAAAARNSAGTMSAVNGPYTPNSVISSSAINARFADIESEITASLSRDAKGGMRSALRGIDGTVAAPALSFTSETGTGLYRIGASDLGVAIAGTKELELTGSLFTVTPALTVTGVSTLTGGATIAGAAAFSGSTGLPAAGGSSVLYIEAGLVSPTAGRIIVGDGSNWRLSFAKRTGSVDTEVGYITDTGVASFTGGTIIGTSGTLVSGSFAASAAWNPGSIAAGSTAGTTITVTGAAAAAPCMVGSPVPNTGVYLWCWVAPANNCNLQLVNPTAAPITGTSGTYSCRVFNP